MENKYIHCPSCKDNRDDGNLELAINCSAGCKGKGIIQNPKSFICNNCGNNLYDEKSKTALGLKNITVRGGFYSKYLFDCTTYTFSLCEKCLREMFTDFYKSGYPPEVFDSDGKIEYKLDLAADNTRVWEQNGGKEKNIKAGICNLDEFCKNKAEYRVFYFKQVSNDCRCEEHKWKNIAGNGKLAPFYLVPFVKAETEEEKQKEKLAYENAIEFPLQEIF